MQIEIISDGPVSPNYGENNPDVCCAFPLAAIEGGDSLSVIYRKGQDKHSADGVLVMQSTDDGGLCWSDPRTVYDGTRLEPRQTVVTGGAVQCTDGSLLVAVATVEGLAEGEYMFTPEVRQRLPRHIFVLRSNNRGTSWSEPDELRVPGVRWAGIVAPPLVLPDGRVAISLEIPLDSGVHGTAVVYSNDAGRTFGPPTIVATDRGGDINYADGRLAALSDGSLLCGLWAFRKDDEKTLPVHIARSTDSGDSWSTPKSTAWEGQVTSLLHRDSGVLLAATNVRTHPAGSRLMVSTDFGFTWEDEWFLMWDAESEQLLGKAMQTTPGGVSLARGADTAGDDDGVWDALKAFRFGVPTLSALADDQILLTYWAEVDGITHIRAARFIFRVTE